MGSSLSNSGRFSTSEPGTGLVKAVREVAAAFELALDHATKTAAAAGPSSLGDCDAVHNAVTDLQRRQAADGSQLRALAIGGCIAQAVSRFVPSHPPDSTTAATAAAFGVLLLYAHDEVVGAVPRFCRAVQRTHAAGAGDAYAASLRDKMANATWILAATFSEATVGWADELGSSNAAERLSEAQCATLASRLRTPRSVGQMYRPPGRIPLDFAESLRPLWAVLDEFSEAFTAVVARYHAARASANQPRPPTADSPRGAPQSPRMTRPTGGQGLRNFRPRPQSAAAAAPGSSGASAAEAAQRHQAWVFDVHALPGVVARHNDLWTRFAQRLAAVATAGGTCAPTKMSAASFERAAGIPASVAALGDVPWPETVLDGIRAAAADGRLARSLEAAHTAAIARFVQESQRRWHPDRWQSLLLRAGLAADSDTFVRIVKRCTAISQTVNGLRHELAISV